MGINDDAFNYYNEQNRRNHAANYQASFPLIQAYTKVGGTDSDPDWQNAIGDYSGSPQVFEFDAFDFADAYVDKIVVNIVTTANMDYDEYGDIAGGITNGVVIAFYQKGEYRIVSPTIHTNYDYQRLFNGNVVLPEWDKGPKAVTYTLQLDVPLILKGGTDDVLQIQLNDDFSSLIGHHLTAVGWTTNLKEFQGA